jgi:hypothetical protein
MNQLPSRPSGIHPWVFLSRPHTDFSVTSNCLWQTIRTKMYSRSESARLRRSARPTRNGPNVRARVHLQVMGTMQTCRLANQQLADLRERSASNGLSVPGEALREIAASQRLALSAPMALSAITPSGRPGHSALGSAQQRLPRQHQPLCVLCELCEISRSMRSVVRPQ